MSEGKDLYTILGVARSATEDEIRRAYRKLARTHHPDVNPGNKQAEEKFKEFSAAYEVLSNPEKRKLYGEFGTDALRSGFDPEKARTYREWAEGRKQAGRPFDTEAVEFDLGDLFGDVMGARAPGFRAQGQDIIAVVELDFVQALRGGEIELRVRAGEPCGRCRGSGDEPGTTPETCADCGGSGRRQAVRGPMRILATCAACGGQGRRRKPCPSCGGAGATVAERPLTIRIPPGAEDGERLRVKGRGAPGIGGAPPGDLLVETRIRPHPHFRREGIDLYLRLPVTLDEAYLGAEVEVPAPDGLVMMKVPPRSQQAARLRLRGKGVARGDKRGDLYVELDVRLPDGEDAALGEALRRARGAYSNPVRGGIRL